MTTFTSYTDALRAELTSVGIGGRLRARIVTEIEDHLACDPAAELGPPTLLARQFADELGTLHARHAATRSFTALALAGLLFGAAFVNSPAAAFGAAPAGAPLLGLVARVAAVIAPQLAFVAGVLALLRVLRRRRVQVIARAEAQMIVRRATVGTAAGLVTTISLGVIALVFAHQVSAGWQTIALVASGVGTAALVVALPSLLGAARLRPVAPGGRGDLFDDLGPVVPRGLRGRPWRLAVLIAAAVAIVIALVGGAGNDPYDGLAVGVADGLVCLLGFATLGRYLGLWCPGGSVAVEV